MASFRQERRVTAPRLRVLARPVLAVLWFLAGCVDLTPPWSKVTAQGGAGGSGGATPDGAAGTGGALDAGAGGRIDTGGLGGTSGEAGGLGGAIDAPPPGTGGAIDAGRGGAGSAIDVAIPGTGGAAFDGGAGGAPDVPLPGTGGRATGGTTGGTGGATGTGGTSGKGGTTGTGGVTGTGGTSGKGGTTGSGGSGKPDVGPDLGPDLGPDITPDTSTLGTGLVAYYKCESASNTSLPDSSGNSNDGTLSGSYSFGAGKIGNALTLAKSGNGYVSLPTKIFQGSTEITIAAWVNVTTTLAWQRILDVGSTANTTANPSNGTTNIYMNMIAANNTGYPSSSITASGHVGQQTLTGTSSLPTASWTHVAVVLGAGTATLYINAASVATSTSMLRPADLGTIGYAYVGKSWFTSDPYFDGMIDEFRVYNRALSATEVLALYNFTGP
jgi:hypothetical protein